MKTEILQRLEDARIREDLLMVLRDGAWKVELEEVTVEISGLVKIDVVARSFHSYEFDVGFGDHFRVLVAVGGVEGIEHGIPRAAVCFATLWYSPGGGLVTVDFSEAMM